MKSWNTAVGVTWRTQGTTSSWLHPFSYFFFLTSSLFFVFCILYFYENNKWASPGVIYSIASLSPIYGLLFLFIFICFSFVSFIFRAPCQTVVNSLVNASGTYTQYTHPRVSIRSGGWSPFTFFLAIRFRLFLSTFLFRRPVRERIDDVVIVIYCRRLVVGRESLTGDVRSFFILYMDMDVCKICHRLLNRECLRALVFSLATAGPDQPTSENSTFHCCDSTI